MNLLFFWDSLSFLNNFLIFSGLTVQKCGFYERECFEKTNDKSISCQALYTQVRDGHRYQEESFI